MGVSNYPLYIKTHFALQKKMQELFILNPFLKYIYKIFPSKKSFFQEWDLNKIVSDVSQWNGRAKWIRFYLIVNNSKRHKNAYYIGCSEDVRKRLKQHNGFVKGGPSETRKAMGKWIIAFTSTLPPIRNFRGRDLVKECKGGRGGPASKIARCINSVTKRGLLFKLSMKLLDKKSDFYMKDVKDMIKSMIKKGLDVKDILI